MPRSKKGGFVDAATGGVGAGTPADSGGAGSMAGVLGVQARTDRDTVTCEALFTILTRCDGYLRVIPQNPEGIVYWKWKFTSGRWKGYYTMWRADVQDMHGACCGLEGRLMDIDQGLRRPSLDTPYSDGE